MEWLQSLYFVRPWWFLALLPLAVLVWWLLKHRTYTTAWESICDQLLLPFILKGRSMSDKKAFLYLIGLSGVIAITALAGPVWERLPQPTFRDHSALVIAVDMSRSMDAVDIQPSRIQRARYKISDFINQYQQEVALVAYSNEAFVVVPLTDDIRAVELFLQSIGTNLMPGQGSRPDKALLLAEELLKRRGIKQGGIILVTDYGDQRAVETAAQLVAKNYRTSVLGVGTEQGGPIFLAKGDLLKANGEPVIPQLNETILNNIATVGGGIYQRLRIAGNQDIDSLIQWAKSAAESDVDMESHSSLTDAWREQGPWLVLLLLPLAALAFRRGVLSVLLACFIMQPQDIWAFSWKDLWLRPDQQAARLFQEGKLEQAAEMFEDEEWKASMEYRNGRFTESAEILKDIDNARAQYNKGNALARDGQLKEAIQAYTESLRVNPDMEDATHNMGIVQQVLQQMQTQQAQGEGEPTDEPPDGEQQAGEMSEQEQSEDQESEGNEQQQSDSSDNQQQESEDESSDPDGEQQLPEDSGEDDDSSAEDTSEGTDSEELLGEEEQALEQVLQQVQDNPSRLLRRKFNKLNKDRKRQGRSQAKQEDPW